MANRFFPNAGHFYSTHNVPVQIDCNFIVDHTNGNGLGIRSLKGAGILNVFMNTNQTPGVGNGSVTNPNPAAGTILVQFVDNYNRIFTGSYSLVSPVGTPIKIDNSAMTPGVAYVITTLGDASAAKWVSIGVPAGVTPAVGVAFIASTDGGSVNTSTSRVAPTAAAGSACFQIESVGDGNLSIAPNQALQPYGANVILQTRNATSGGVSQIAAVADGTVISLNFIMSNSSVLIAGE